MTSDIEQLREEALLLPYSVLVRETEDGDQILLEWNYYKENMWSGIMRESDGMRCGMYEVEPEEMRTALLTHFGLERFEAEFTIPFLIDRHPRELAQRRRREEKRCRSLKRLEMVSATPNASIPAEEFPDHRDNGYW